MSNIGVDSYIDVVERIFEEFIIRKDYNI